jgi:hypothetical protein
MAAVAAPFNRDLDFPSSGWRADVFYFPSVKERFGLAAVKPWPPASRSSPRPPVLHEVFRDAVRFASSPAGFADAMRAALRSPGSHRSAGQALAAQYTWDAAAAAHLRL